VIATDTKQTSGFTHFATAVDSLSPSESGTSGTCRSSIVSSTQPCSWARM